MLFEAPKKIKGIYCIIREETETFSGEILFDLK